MMSKAAWSMSALILPSLFPEWWKPNDCQKEPVALQVLPAAPPAHETVISIPYYFINSKCF
jgi:hypothetical protein